MEISIVKLTAISNVHTHTHTQNSYKTQSHRYFTPFFIIFTILGGDGRKTQRQILFNIKQKPSLTFTSSASDTVERKHKRKWDYTRKDFSIIPYRKRTADHLTR